MITLNKDYSEIKSQMSYIKEYLDTCDIPSRIYEYMELYDILKEASTKKRKLSHTKDFSLEQYEIYNTENKKHHERLKKNLKEQTPFLSSFLKEAYHSVSSLLEELNDTCFDLIYQNNHTPRKIEADQWLFEFFKEGNEELKEVFIDMNRHKRIYYNNIDKDAHTIYNPLQKIPNIFLPMKELDIEGLIALVHELGHVVDEQELCNRSTNYNYIYSSFYQEVVSYHYEQKFLEFLIENDIYPKEAKIEVLNSLDFLCENLKKNMKVIKKKKYNREELFNNLQYSFGPLIAPLLDSNIAKDEFFSFQYDYFDYRKWDEAGVPLEKSIHTYVKKTRNIINRGIKE